MSCNSCVPRSYWSMDSDDPFSTHISGRPGSGGTVGACGSDTFDRSAVLRPEKDHGRERKYLFINWTRSRSVASLSH